MNEEYMRRIFGEARAAAYQTTMTAVRARLRTGPATMAQLRSACPDHIGVAVPRAVSLLLETGGVVSSGRHIEARLRTYELNPEK